MHTYDLHGWYVGDSYPSRQAVAPENTSQTTTPGQMRANWTGYDWVDLPYVAPVIDTPPVVVPAAVTMRQARLALLGAGLLPAVETAIDAMTEPTKSAARIEWEYSNELQRGNALVAALGPALGLTGAQIDQLFIAAEGL
jgi:hypothetical protein